MATRLLALFSLLVILVVSTGADEPTCVETNVVHHCFDTVRSLDGISSSPINIAVGESTLDHACSKFKEAKRCTELYENCPAIHKKIQELKWDTTRGAMNYVCDRGYYAFERSNTCWKSSIIATAVNDCTKEEQRGKNNRDATNEEKCRVHNKAVECFVNAVKRNCSEEATEVMKALQIYKRRPEASAINCTLVADDGSYSGSSRMIYPCLTILTLVSAIVLSMSSWIGERI